MTVKELKASLAELPEDTRVAIDVYRDAERRYDRHEVKEVGLLRAGHRRPSAVVIVRADEPVYRAI